jgi:superfamily II DNA or RNA helicase
MDLRPYQQTLVSTTKTKFRNGEHSVLVVLGCGGGKSVIAAKIAKQTTAKNHDVIFIVHRRELCEQIRRTFNLCGVNPERCRIEMVQTLCRRSFPQPKLLIIDEAHHVMADSYQKVLDKCKGSYVIGFTATPERLDGKSLKDVFGTEIKGPTVQWLIDHKFLSDYTAYNAPLLSTDGMHIRHGDYVKDDIDAAMSTKLFGDAVNNWKRIANGRKTIVYCHSVEA